MKMLWLCELQAKRRNSQWEVIHWWFGLLRWICESHFCGLMKHVWLFWYWIKVHDCSLHPFPSGARDITQRAIERALAVPHDFTCVHFQMAKLREKLASSLEMSSQIYYHPSIAKTVEWDGFGANVHMTVTSFLPQRWFSVTLSPTSPFSSMKQFPPGYWKPAKKTHIWSTAGWQIRPTIKSNIWSTQYPPAHSWCFSMQFPSKVSKEHLNLSL